MSIEVFEQVQKKLILAKENKIFETVENMALAEKGLKSNHDPKEIVSQREVGENHYKLAKIYYDKADLEKAEYYFLQALDACELPQDAFAMMKISGFLVRVYSEFLRKEETNNYIKISQMLLDTVFMSKDWQGRAEYFFYMGSTKTYLGEFAEANKNFSLAVKKAQESNEPEVVAKSLLLIAQNYFQMGDLDQSFRGLCQLEQLLSILNKGYLKGSMYLLYANIYNRKGEQSRAIEYYKRSLEELNKKSCWNLIGYITLGMGVSYKKMGDYKKSILHFEMAQNLTSGSHFKKLHARINGEINEVNDSDIDFIIDKTERVIKEKTLGVIDFKHRFVLLEILYLLASNPGNYFDKEDLSREIWREEYNPLIHDKLIYTSISRLRKLIEPGGEKNKYIVRGKDGYTFSPHVKVRFCHNANGENDAIGNIEISAPL